MVNVKPILQKELSALRRVPLICSKFVPFPPTFGTKYSIVKGSPTFAIRRGQDDARTPHQKGNNVDQPQIARFGKRRSSQFRLIINICALLVKIAYHVHISLRDSKIKGSPLLDVFGLYLHLGFFNQKSNHIDVAGLDCKVQRSHPIFLPDRPVHIEGIENPTQLQITQLAGPVTAVHLSLCFLDYSRLFYTDPSLYHQLFDLFVFTIGDGVKEGVLHLFVSALLLEELQLLSRQHTLVEGIKQSKSGLDVLKEVDEGIHCELLSTLLPLLYHGIKDLAFAQCLKDQRFLYIDMLEIQQIFMVSFRNCQTHSLAQDIFHQFLEDACDHKTRLLSSLCQLLSDICELIHGDVLMDRKGVYLAYLNLNAVTKDGLSVEVVVDDIDVLLHDLLSAEYHLFGSHPG